MRTGGQPGCWKTLHWIREVASPTCPGRAGASAGPVPWLHRGRVVGAWRWPDAATGALSWGSGTSACLETAGKLSAGGSETLWLPWRPVLSDTCWKAHRMFTSVGHCWVVTSAGGRAGSSWEEAGPRARPHICARQDLGASVVTQRRDSGPWGVTVTVFLLVTQSVSQGGSLPVGTGCRCPNPFPTSRVDGAREAFCQRFSTVKGTRLTLRD